MKSPEQGAATSVHAALSEEWRDSGGKFLSNCVEQGPFASQDFLDGDGYAAHAYDPVREQRLWKDSLKMSGLPDDGQYA
jgi:hypothetical protein